VARGRVDSFRLRNGLTVYLAPVPASPTASVWVWYRVGSVNERPGITGVSHWVEHMLFQGSRRFEKGEMDRAIVEVGGSANAFTDMDFTAYLTTVPKERISVPLRIESDRMTGARMAAVEAEREREVILSEREGNENRPEFKVEEELYALAYQLHPYRWDPLGFELDMRSMPATAVRDYYGRFYGPPNAILVVSGGFEPARLRAEIRERFGAIPPRGENPRVREEEPRPHASRRGVLRGPGSTPIVRIGWRAPSIADPRAPHALLVGHLLGGDTSLFSTQPFGWRAVEHPNSRLYRQLVESGLAVRVSSEYRPRTYPGLFTVSAQASPGVSLDRVEHALRAEVARVVHHGPTPRELADARATLSRGARLAYEGSTRIAFRVGYFATYGGLGLEDRLLRGLLAADAGSVREEAQRLFADGHDVTVRYEPEGAGRAR
jgi:zinc protease